MWLQRLDRISDLEIDHTAQSQQHFEVRPPIRFLAWKAWRRRALRTAKKERCSNVSTENHSSWHRCSKLDFLTNMWPFHLWKIFEFANGIWITDERQSSSTFDYFRNIIDVHIMRLYAQKKICYSITRISKRFVMHLLPNYQEFQRWWFRQLNLWMYLNLWLSSHLWIGGENCIINILIRV